MGKLILIRHGESTFNDQGIWTGHLDPSLSDKGKQSAQAVAVALKDYKIDHAFISDLERSLKTWDIIHNSLAHGTYHIPPTIDAKLRERDYGDFAGKNKWEVKQQIGEEEFKRIRRSWDYPIPNGESLKDVYNRVVPFYQQEMKPLLDRGETIVAVTHGNTNRALIKYLDGISDADIADLEMPHNLIVMYEFKDGKIVSKEEKRL